MRVLGDGKPLPNRPNMVNHIVIGRMDEMDEDLEMIEYWLSRPVHERLDAFELLRERYYGEQVRNRSGLYGSDPIIRSA